MSKVNNLHVKLNDELAAILDEYCDRWGMDKSAVIKQLIYGLRNLSVEDRLSALEARMSKIELEACGAKDKPLYKGKLFSSPQWIDVVGSISDEEAYDEAMKYGAEFRGEGDRDDKV